MGGNLMRTVTFADPATVDRMNRDFVLLWSNQQPDLVNGVPTSPEQAQAPWSQEEARMYPLGGGGGNLRTFFCDADGRVLHYLEGYWTPEVYGREMEFATGLSLADDLETRLAARKVEIERRQEELLASSEAARARPGTTEESRQAAALGLLARTFDTGAQYLRQPIDPVLERIRIEGERRGVIS
ncbi:MAG: hypothetical protein HY725_02870 [Candidatus Rokubacteria bacterium]|nr:hypothetical protein [Candidatus Rokubacteria bacterium]